MKTSNTDLLHLMREAILTLPIKKSAFKFYVGKWLYNKFVEEYGQAWVDANCVLIEQARTQ